MEHPLVTPCVVTGIVLVAIVQNLGFLAVEMEYKE